MKNRLKRILLQVFKRLFPRSSELHLHRIPFGPIKGKVIYTSFEISPRMYLGIDEPFIARLSREYIKPDDIVYDIGAHIGYTSLLFAQQLRGSGAVHAFEILPSTNYFLEKTVEANQFNNIFVHNVGLASDTYTIELSHGSTMMASLVSDNNIYINNNKELCCVDFLDHYVEKNRLPIPSFIKIDIEGAEIDCIKGGINLIKGSKPKMVIEFHSLELLREGYQIMTDHLNYKMINQKGVSLSTRFIAGLKSFHESLLCVPME